MERFDSVIMNSKMVQCNIIEVFDFSDFHTNKGSVFMVKVTYLFSISYCSVVVECDTYLVT